MEEFVVPADFVSADTEKIADFEAKSPEVIEEFNSIRTKFGEINADLLQIWDGDGSDEYRWETDHILEKIGGIAEILDAINNGIVKAIKDNYSLFDDELGAFNRNPVASEE